MDRKLWAALTAAAVVAIGVWVAVQSFEANAPQQPIDTPASSPDPDYWDSERMRDATPAPMPTVD